jgi:hypothetical protein
MGGLRASVDILRKKNSLNPTGIQTPNRLALNLVSIRTTLSWLL